MSMASDLAIFTVGFLSSGVIRFSVGRLVIREHGRWQFRFVRFDEREQEEIDRINKAIHCANAMGRMDAYREFESCGSVSMQNFEEKP